jgi:hypothetical protein
MLKQHEEHFAEEDQWIAALVRQHFRSVLAADSKAQEVSLFYLKGYLCKLLGSHLHLAKDQRWISRNAWLDGLGGEQPICHGIRRFALRDMITWATRDQKDWYIDPFEFLNLKSSYASQGETSRATHCASRIIGRLAKKDAFRLRDFFSSWPGRHRLGICISSRRKL